MAVMTAQIALHDRYGQSRPLHTKQVVCQKDVPVVLTVQDEVPYEIKVLYRGVSTSALIPSAGRVDVTVSGSCQQYRITSSGTDLWISGKRFGRFSPPEKITKGLQVMLSIG